MESFKILVCFAFLAVCAFAAEQLPPQADGSIPATAAAVSEPVREKKQALLPLAATAYSGYPYYSAGYAYPYAYPYAYSYGAYDDGKYYPGKYEKPYGGFRSIPSYYNYPGYYYY